MGEIFLNNGETWLICGGRAFANQDMFNEAMSDLMRHFGCPAKIVHGAARGADAMADILADRLAIDVRPFPADWITYGKAAGPIRNSQMLADEKPAKVIAFPGDRGTADMVAKSRAAGVTVIEIKTT